MKLYWAQLAAVTHTLAHAHTHASARESAQGGAIDLRELLFNIELLFNSPSHTCVCVYHTINATKATWTYIIRLLQHLTPTNSDWHDYFTFIFSVTVLLYWCFGKKCVCKTSKPLLCLWQRERVGVTVFVCEKQQVGGPVITVWPIKQDLLFNSSALMC